MIIDVHSHLGRDRVFDEIFSESEQFEKIKVYGIEHTILQPALVHTLEEVTEQHNDIYSLSKRHPDLFSGMANPNPHLKDDDYEKEVRRCVEDLGFVGLKVHTFAHGVNPTSKDGLKVFEWGRKLNVPVMVHTGAGIPFSNPSNLMPVAEEFPDVPIIIAHCGMMVLAGETFLAMKQYKNLFADITWTGGFMIREAVHQLGAERFMFGTDHADNCGTEYHKIKTIGLTQEEQEWIFYKSALNVFKLPINISK